MFDAQCWCWLLAGPAQVFQLLVSNNGTTDSLQAQWERPFGDLDSYRLLLVHDSSVIKNQSVGANTTGISFHGLRPGALYKVVLTTSRAEKNSRQTVVEGRTGKDQVGTVVLCLFGFRFQSMVKYVELYRFVLRNRMITSRSHVRSKKML